MLESIRRGQRWLTGLFIAVIGAVFVFFLGLGGGAPQGGFAAGADTVVALDDLQLTLRDFERAYERTYARLQDESGGGLRPNTAEQFARQQAIRALVETAILAHSAGELGLAAGKREIQELLRTDPSLRDAEGRFDRENFEAYVEHEFGSQRLFLEVMRLDLLRSKMVQILFSQAHVSEGEAVAASRQRLEEVELAAVVLDTKQLPPDLALDDEAVEAYATENETNLRALYDEDPTQFSHPAQAKASHILVGVAAESGEEGEAAAREAIEAARARIVEGGEAFADVAREVSDDPGTKESGGDLGWFARFEVEPSISGEAFKLEPGSVSEPVRGSRGWQIILVEDRRDEGIDPYEDIRLDLARRQATSAQAGERARKLSEELKAAVAGGATLEDAARERELTLLRTGRFRRRADGAIPQVGAARDVMTAAFASAPETPSFDRVWPNGDRLVMAQVLAHHVPSDEELESDLQITRERLVDQKRNRLIRAWIDEREKALDEEGRLFVNYALLSDR